MAPNLSKYWHCDKQNIGASSSFQWMVAGRTGLSGHHVVKHVEMEYSLERENVPTHPRPTVEQDVRETPQQSESAIWELVQVREIIVGGLLYISLNQRLPLAMTSRILSVNSVLESIPRKTTSG